MTPEREAELLRHIPTLGSLAEATGFREALRDKGECTGTVMVRLQQRMDVLAKREGVR